MAGDSGWVSREAAAVIAGCISTTIHTAVRAGKIRCRQGLPRGVPSLERGSVDAWAQARQIAADAARVKREEQQARSVRPPDDGDVWLTSTTVALVLGISTTRVDQLARIQRLPYTRRGVRRWFRRSHIEQIAAARALRQTSRVQSGAKVPR